MRICTLLIALILIEKQVLAWSMLSASQSLQDLGFGFGEYVRALLHHEGYVNCASESGYCEHASRMPMLPLLMAGLALIADNQLTAALLKNLMLSALTLASIRHILKIPSLTGRSLHIPGSLAIAATAPALLKHAAQITYEEGLLIELLLIWLFYFIAALQLAGEARQARAKLAGCLSALVLVASAILLTKSSMLLLWLLSLGVTLHMLQQRQARPSGILMLALMASIALVGSWGRHVYQHTGQLSVMSTYDGSNVYRAWNDTALAIYPQVSLDRILDTTIIELPDGTRVVNALAKHHPLALSEADWNQRYRAAGSAWIKAHPGQALHLLALKMENFFFSVRKTPCSVNGGAAPGGLANRVDRLLNTLWLVTGRLGEALLLVALWRGRHLPGKPSIWLSCALLGYAAPYIAGFNYERHITPFLLMVLTTLLCMTWGWSRPAPEKSKA